MKTNDYFLKTLPGGFWVGPVVSVALFLSVVSSETIIQDDQILIVLNTAWTKYTLTPFYERQPNWPLSQYLFFKKCYLL